MLSPTFTALAPASKHILMIAATTSGLVLPANSGFRSQPMFGFTKTTSPFLTKRAMPPSFSMASWASCVAIFGDRRVGGVLGFGAFPAGDGHLDLARILRAAAVSAAESVASPSSGARQQCIGLQRQHPGCRRVGQEASSRILTHDTISLELSKLDIG